MSPAVEEVVQTDVLTLLRPTGYHLLVRATPVPEKTKSGVFLAPDARKAEEIATCTGTVLAMGPGAYTDKDRFPGGPWCQVGDGIVMRPYSGTRFKIDGQEYRLINDDTVEAVVGDPTRVERV